MELEDLIQSDYLNVISPDYVIISNEIGNPNIITLYTLEEKEIQYIYSSRSI